MMTASWKLIALVVVGVLVSGCFGQTKNIGVEVVSDFTTSTLINEKPPEKAIEIPMNQSVEVERGDYAVLIKVNSFDIEKGTLNREEVYFGLLDITFTNTGTAQIGMDGMMHQIRHSIVEIQDSDGVVYGSRSCTGSRTSFEREYEPGIIQSGQKRRGRFVLCNLNDNSPEYNAIITVPVPTKQILDGYEITLLRPVQVIITLKST